VTENIIHTWSPS